jgi:enoyl-CoA hydratase/carnithine racemase
LSDFETILFESDADGIAVVTLNRPEQLNALNPKMAEEIVQVMDEIDNDPHVRGVILTGAGRAFCAGADISVGPAAFAPLPDMSSSSSAIRDWGGVLVLRILQLNKPIIAAINGPAVGIGATMTLPCDIRLAATGAKIGFVFARRGIVTDGCSSWFLPRIVGISTALRWCMTGSIISAEEARAERLVSSLSEPDELLSAAREIINDIAANTSALSVSLTRQLLWRGLVEDHPMGSHYLESRLIGPLTMPGADAEEGVASFLEKRPVKFRSEVPRDLPKDWPFWREPTYEDYANPDNNSD